MSNDRSSWEQYIWSGMRCRCREGHQWEVLRPTPEHAMPGWVCQSLTQNRSAYLDAQTIVQGIDHHPMVRRFHQWWDDGPFLYDIGEYADDQRLEQVEWDDGYEEATASLVIDIRGLEQQLPLIWREDWDEPQVLAYPDPEYLLGLQEAPSWLWLELLRCVSGLLGRQAIKEEHLPYLRQYLKEGR